MGCGFKGEFTEGFSWFEAYEGPFCYEWRENAPVRDLRIPLFVPSSLLAFVPVSAFVKVEESVVVEGITQVADLMSDFGLTSDGLTDSVFTTAVLLLLLLLLLLSSSMMLFGRSFRIRRRAVVSMSLLRRLLTTFRARLVVVVSMALLVVGLMRVRLLFLMLMSGQHLLPGLLLLSVLLLRDNVPQFFVFCLLSGPPPSCWALLQILLLHLDMFRRQSFILQSQRIPLVLELVSDRWVR